MIVIREAIAKFRPQNAEEGQKTENRPPFDTVDPCRLLQSITKQIVPIFSTKTKQK